MFICKKATHLRFPKNILGKHTQNKTIISNSDVIEEKPTVKSSTKRQSKAKNVEDEKVLGNNENNE